jgi:hypothetical protein
MGIPPTGCESAKPARMINRAAAGDPSEHPTESPGTGRSETASRRARLRRRLLVAIALLYVVSVPWYRETGAQIQVWFGLPDWVAVAIACYIGVAVLNAIAWTLTDIPDGTSEAGNDNSSDHSNVNKDARTGQSGSGIS